jgi:Amt family ammonium transporter
MPAILIGLAAGILSNFIASLRARTTLDDSLDVFACHGAGGILGTFATGLFASTAINATGPNGLFYGNPAQLVAQIIGIVVVASFAFAGSYALLRGINYVSPIRVPVRDEDAGLDVSQHGESAYG